MLYTAYYSHNLYTQYQHNKAKEKQVIVKLDGVEKAVDISPQYFDSYTTYNLFGVIGIATGVGGLILDSNIVKTSAIVLNSIGFFSKIFSMLYNYNDLTFTDHETGEIIPHDKVMLFENEVLSLSPA